MHFDANRFGGPSFDWQYSPNSGIQIQYPPGNLQYEAVRNLTHSDSISPTDMFAVEGCPEGYPRLAALLDSDENFMLYRRFGYLQARLLLYKQDELREAERDLNESDIIDARGEPSWLKSREKDDKKSRRKEILKTIETKFLEYSKPSQTLKPDGNWNDNFQLNSLRVPATLQALTALAPETIGLSGSISMSTRRLLNRKVIYTIKKI